jgi:hypothetical protein
MNEEDALPEFPLTGSRCDEAILEGPEVRG